LQIADGVWQLKIPMSSSSLQYTFSYLVSNSATLIDTGVGTDEARSALTHQLKELDCPVSKIRHLVITHLHRDHVGLVEYIQSVSDAITYASERAVDLLPTRATHDEGEYQAFREEMILLGEDPDPQRSGQPRFSVNSSPFTFHIDERVVDGKVLPFDGVTLQAIWTPGHSSGHLCLLDVNRRLFFSGDHVLPHITSHIHHHPYQDGDPLRDYLVSLTKVYGLSVDLVLPGHEYAFHDLDGRISELLRHHESRCDEVKQALSQGVRTVFQIAAQISWQTQPWRLMPVWSKHMAVVETLAHLVYLKHKGDVDEQLIGGVLYYRRSS
jgi:glyoxylase-like metal-dependent hydrolase (beta-lactamase superfamily II)